VNYTDELTESIVAEYEANPSKDTVAAIAERTGKSVKSIIAKLSSEGVYKTPERLTKTGEPVEKKEEMVLQISAWLGIDVPTLAKSGKQDLKKLRDGIQDLMEGLNG